MTAATRFIAAFLALSAAPVVTPRPFGIPTPADQAAPAQTKIDGEWTIYLGTRKPAMFKGALSQTGQKVSGFFGDETAEYPVTGTIVGSDVKFVFSFYEGGDTIKVSVTGKFERDTITGTAKMGDLNVEVNCQRTSQ